MRGGFAAWGGWEGRDLHEMEATVAPEIQSADHRPENGGSRRVMLSRIGALLADAAQSEATQIVVTHRGVIRTVYGIATDWDLTGESPDEMSRRRAQIEQLNLPLNG